MKDIVSFETAKRLRDAGFPQPGYPIPDPAHYMGRVMYDADGDKFMCFWQEEDGGGVISLTPFMNNKQDCRNPLVFAPTATDILRELPGLDFELVYSEGNEDFAVHQTLDGDIINSWNDENPAELMAKPYLHLKNKK